MSGSRAGRNRIRRAPQPPRHARAEPGGAAGTLIGRVERDPLGDEHVESARRVVASDLDEPRIHHGRHAGYRERRLGDVGGQNHAPRRCRPHRRVLGGAVERAVQGHDLDSGRHDRGDLTAGPFDLAASRQETQDLTGRARQQRPHRRGHRLAGRVVDLQRMERAGYVEHGAGVEVARHRRGVERGRHHQQVQIITRPPGLAGQGQPEDRDGDCVRGTRRGPASRPPRAAGPAAGGRSECPR